MVLVDWFYPGYKAGGPIQSCRNFVHFMEQDYEVRVLTSDRDLGDVKPYPGITPDAWNYYTENTKVYYATALSLASLNKLIREFKPDHIYVNSMFSARFSLMPLLLKRFGRCNANIFLAPRGMLKQSALQFKPLKKKIYLSFFRSLGLQKGIHFHATDKQEVTDIKRELGESARVTLLANFPGVQQPFQPPPPRTTALKIIFVGRIHPIKKLDFLIACLQKIRSNVQLTVVAALEDEAYWQQCETLIKALPANITVQFKGNIPHDELESVLYGQHLFVLPTQGENFGHAIFEALAAGRPVLISDQTPWRNLAAAKAGWDLPLREPASFIEAIEEVAAMEDATLNAWCLSAWQYCAHFIASSGLKTEYQKLFN